MTFLSICIPTFNRRICLINCLNSIKIACKNLNFKFDVCISDNSDYSNSDIIKKYKKFFKIIYHKNKNNIGISKNMLKVINLSKSKFTWLLGDDDLVHPSGLKIIKNLFNDKKNKDIDFFYLNSGILNAKIIFKQKQPYNTNKLPKNIKKHSNYKYEGKIKFMDLINKNISFDFLGGMYTSIFKRKIQTVLFPLPRDSKPNAESI